jgi:integrase/recombinase XerD
LSIKDTLMGSTPHGCGSAVVQITEFVAGYASAATRAAYRSDLSLWSVHCRAQSQELFEVRRADIEGYARRLEADGLAPATINRRLATITGFYRWALDEGLVMANPAGNVRRPRRPSESPRAGLARTELKDWLNAAEGEGGHPYALACLLAINGLRVGEACGADVTDLAEDRWHHTLTIHSKGDKTAVAPLPPRTVAAIDAIVAGRTAGPLLLTRAGTRMNRPAAARIVARLARNIGCGKHITPLSLRHSAITAALNAGVSLRDVQEFARHADPRTTIRYDNSRELRSTGLDLGLAC